MKPWDMKASRARVADALAKMYKIDRQAQRVYGWERKEVIPDPSMTKDEPMTVEAMQKLADQCTDRLGIKPVTVIYEEARYRPGARFYHREIMVGPKSRQPWAILHEIAHVAAMSPYHWGAWQKKYFELLRAFGGFSNARLLKSWNKIVKGQEV